MNLFFKPWVNIELYNIGLSGHKILVVGASHYCPYDKCPYFKECTSKITKDSSPFNLLCPYCDKDLSHTTIEAVEYFLGGDQNVSYRNFSDFMTEIMGLANDDKTLWNHIAFMNYVQYMLGTDIFTEYSDMQERDYEAFKEVVIQLRPDIIIAWGKAGEDIKRHKIGNNIIGVDENYIFEIEIENHSYRVIHCYHPCDIFGWFSNDIERLSKQLSILLK